MSSTDFFGEARRLLVREVNWLGDVVISLPALRAIRRAAPKAHLAVLVRDNLASFFDGALEGNDRLLDEVIPFRFRRGIRGLMDRHHLERKILRPHGFDRAVLLPNSFDSAWVAFWADIPRRAGYSRDARRLLLTHAVPVTEAILSRHQVQYYLNLVEALGAPGNPDDYAIPVSSAALKKADELLGASKDPRVALAAGAAYGPAKAYFAERYGEIADRLLSEGWTPVFVGAPGVDADISARIVERSMRSGARAINAAGRTNVAELIALLSRCRAFIGNDSGAMHVAGVLGLSTIGIFGSSEPGRTAPLGPRVRTIAGEASCRPCFLRECPYLGPEYLRCFDEIKTDRVLEEFHSMIKNGPAVPTGGST